MKTEFIKIEVRVERPADPGVLRERVVRETGALHVDFCPPVEPGGRYRGHAHALLPTGASNPPEGPIEVTRDHS